MSIDTGDIDHTHGAAIGAGNQANSQQVHVHLGLDQEPRTQAEKINAMWKIVSTDVLDRRERQREADAWRKTMQIWLIALTIISMLNTGLIIVRW